MHPTRSSFILTPGNGNDSWIHCFHPSIAPNKLLGQDSIKNIRSFSRFMNTYLLEQAMNGNCWIEPIVKEDSMEMLKPLIIPSKGKAIRVYPWNKTLLRNTLVLHEKKQAEIKNDTLYVEASPCSTAIYQRLLLGRCQQCHQSFGLSPFGFVPEDHIIGKASIIWSSKEKGTGPFSGYRWGRIWKEWNDKQMKE